MAVKVEFNPAGDKEEWNKAYLAWKEAIPKGKLPPTLKDNDTREQDKQKRQAIVPAHASLFYVRPDEQCAFHVRMRRAFHEACSSTGWELRRQRPTQ